MFDLVISTNFKLAALSSFVCQRGGYSIYLFIACVQCGLNFVNQDIQDNCHKSTPIVHHASYCARHAVVPVFIGPVCQVNVK